jgi:hypothetical protein
VVRPSRRSGVARPAAHQRLAQPAWLAVWFSASPGTTRVRRGADQRAALGAANTPAWHGVPRATRLAHDRWTVSVLEQHVANTPARLRLGKSARAPSSDDKQPPLPLLPPTRGQCSARGLLAAARLVQPWRGQASAPARPAQPRLGLCASPVQQQPRRPRASSRSSRRPPSLRGEHRLQVSNLVAPCCMF